MSEATSAGDAAVREDDRASDAAAIVLELLHGDAIPTEDLEPRSVPTDLILPAVLEAAASLVAHGRNCRSPAQCTFTPPPLRKFLKMRAETILRAGHRQVTAALFEYPDYEFTAKVRERVLEDENDLAIEVREGQIFSGARLREFLAEDSKANAQRLGAVLWALRLPDDDARALFRSLAPLVNGTNGQSGPEATTDESPKASRRRQGKEERAAADDAKQAKKDLRAATRKLAEANEGKQRLEGALLEAETTLREREERIVELERELRLARGNLQTIERQRDQAARATGDLRRELEALRSEALSSSTDRSRLSGQVALKNHELETLRARLRAIPTGSDAVHEFLQSEEEKIDQALVIEQGADRLRAQEAHAAHRRLETAFLDAYPKYRQPRPPTRQVKADLRFITLGGSGEIGRSCYLIELGRHSILVDCGIRIGPGAIEDVVPTIERISKLDAVVLTHAHTDHLGWLPALVNRFGDFPIYCTKPTAELAPIMLDDCRKHYLVMMERLRRFNEFSAERVTIYDAYEDDDVFRTKTQLYACAFGEPEVLSTSEVSLHFLRAGHILGAASVLIEGEGRRIFVSGDISSEDQLTVAAADWSACNELEVDLMLLESTYGGTRRPTADATRSQLIEFAAQTLAASGSLILPCFALGRAQEVLRILRDAIDSGALPGVSVWIDGMIRHINPIYADYTDLRLPPNFLQVDGPSERAQVIDEARRDPVLIVTTSGMVTGGPAVAYAAALLPDPKNRIALTGYQDEGGLGREGSPGHSLLRLAAGGTGTRSVEVFDEEGERVTITAAAPAKSFGLSAHADQGGLVRCASHLRPQTVALVHGFAAEQMELRGELSRALPNAKIHCGPSELTIA